MNYRHIYHAGSFADVFKHLVLVGLLQALHHKEKPFCYIDTHAGIGRYDLSSPAAQKTQEYSSGIAKITQQPVIASPMLQAYLAAVSAVNDSSAQLPPRFYPGSPRIARHLLRPQDRMILSELHGDDIALLKQEFHGDKQVAVHQQDGYLALKAFLPPKEKRGLVLIDPPFEQSNELERICTALKSALKHWDTGIYAIWYPIKEKNFTQKLHQQLQLLPCKDILFVELSIYPEDAPISLNGSGMAILNPPWQFDTQLKSVIPWLWQVLSPEKRGCFRIEYGVPRSTAKDF